MSNVPAAAEIEEGDGVPTYVVEDLGRKDFVKYAGASGDFNPIHYNQQFATDAGYPSVFGQGMLTAALMANAVTEWLGLAGLQRFQTRFTGQVWPGNTVTVTGEVTDKYDEDGETLVDLDLQAANEDEAVILGSATVALE